MSKALIGASLLFSEPNCPTREGELVGFVGEIYNIPSPRVGMRVFVVTERREYIITKLRAKVVNGVSVPNAQVDEFVPAGDARVTWNSSSNLNKFTTAGVYEIKGERTMSPSYDNLPINNSGSGHTISARLEVLDSSINDTTNSDDKCITQKLTISNRVGGDGNVYLRTGRGKTYDSISWEPWATLQTNINVGDTRTLNKFVDNGIYSGVWTDEYNSYAETFVMVVINDYAVAGENKTVTQFKYAYDTLAGSGIPTFTTRSLFNGEWSNWTSIKGGGGSGGGVTEDEFNALSQKVNSNSEAVTLFNRTIINYNSRYEIPYAVTKQQVINDLLNKGTADKGTIVTYYAEDGWHTIQYKLNYYSPTEGVKESNWEEIGGASSGGGGSAVETDPVFSASPAASITEERKLEWDRKQDAIADLNNIRSGAAAGATALQFIPSEYVTETELAQAIASAITTTLNTVV